MIQAEDLSNINSESRKLIKEYISLTNDTATGLAKKVGVHPLQMIGYLKGERGLHVDTLEKIGKYMHLTNK